MTTLRPGLAGLEAEVEVVAVARPSDSSKRSVRTAHGDSTSSKPSTRIDLAGGAPRRAQRVAGHLAAAVLVVAVDDRRRG